jgi:ankyrin repeat protein
MNDVTELLRSEILNGDIERISSLIASGGVNLNGTRSPLFEATICGRVDVLNLLLDAGADVNGSSEIYESPCHAAILSNQFDALRLLVERGANVLTSPSAAGVLLRAAHSKPDDRMLVFLLEAGTSLENLTDDFLIRLAIKSVNVLKCLLARNVAVSALRGSSGFMACHCAVIYVDRTDAVEQILRALVRLAAVDVNAGDSHGASALHYAASRLLYDAIAVLAELGADVDQQSTDGVTALHRACGNWKIDGMCSLKLIALGANTRMVNNQGDTACHVAARSHNHVALCACLAGGADMDLLNNDGESPRSIILQQRNVELPPAAGVESARRCVAMTRLNFVRRRALQVCIGLQPLCLDALQICEILLHACGPLANCVLFHHWWKIATTVKHFQSKKKNKNKEQQSK